LLPRFQRWAATTVQSNRGGQDLSLRQLAVLYLIREGAVFPSELARQLRISPAVVTGLLDRLAQRGYLQRLADASDRRRLRLALTDTGLAASLAVEHLLSRDVAEHLTRRPPTSSR
jgi:DNA-binding MarR family transcriptional regulator